MSKPTDRQHKGGIVSPGFASDIDSIRKWSDGRFNYRHHVAWGDCDPAQIAYTANIPKWGLLAIEDWYRICIGFDWYSLNLDLGIGTPFVSLKFEFVSPVKPPAVLEIGVQVKRLGGSSLAHVVKGYQNEELCFEGETIAAFVNASSMTPVPIPANIRASIESFMSDQDHEH